MRSFEELNREFLEDRSLDDFDNVKPEYYEKYLIEINEILEQDSSNIDALKFKYFILFSMDRYEESIEVCNQVLRKCPDDIETLDYKCSCYSQLDQYAECIEVCKKIIEIDPENEDAISDWEIAYIMGSDKIKDLPKPPRTLRSIISQIVAIVVLILLGGLVYYFWLNGFTH